MNIITYVYGKVNIFHKKIPQKTVFSVIFYKFRFLLLCMSTLFNKILCLFRRFLLHFVTTQSYADCQKSECHACMNRQIFDNPYGESHT